MTNKVYRTAQGKVVDLGSIMLQNEHTRAVGNMNVNARGDKLDQNNRVVETKPRQIQRQNSRTTNVSDLDVQTSSIKANRVKKEKSQVESEEPVLTTVEESTPVAVTSPPEQSIPTTGGLAAAIARQREVKQELEKTLRQKQQSQGLRKI